MAIGGATSMLTMAGAGAGIGSFGGPIGTAIGVGAGGAIGLISGALGKLTKSFEDLAKEINDANDKIRREFENASQASRITEEIVRLKSEGGSERQIFMAQKRLNTALSSVYNPKTRLGISGTKAERDAALEEIMDRQASVSIAGDAMSSVRSGLDEGTSIFGADFKDTLKARKTIGAGLSPFLSKQTPEKLNEYREQILKDPQFIKQILKDAGVSEGQIKETLPNESLSKYSTMASMIPVIGPLLGGIGATVGSKDLQSGGVYQRGVLSGINSAIQTKKAAALSDKTSNEEVLRMKGIAELSEKYRQSSEFQKITGGANQSILGVQKQIAFSAPGLTDLNKIGLESYYAKQASQLQYKTESSSQIADTQSRLLSMVKAKGGESPEAIARIKGISGTGDLQRLISDLSSPEGIKKSGLAGVGGLSDEFKKALQEAVRAQESLNKSLEEQNRATDENTSALEKDYRFKGTRAGGASEYGKNAANAEELFNRSLERRDVPDITEALNTQRRIANLNKEFQAGNISQDRYDADVSIGAMSDLLKKQGRENASLSYEPGKEERAKLQRRLNFGTIERRQLDNESSLRTARGENDEEKVRDLLLEQTTILAEKERMMGLITQNQEKITVGVATENKALKDAIETNRVLLDIAKRRGDEEESINKLKINGKNLALEEKFRSNGISEGDLRLERLRNAEKIVGQFESGSSISGKRLARAQEEGLQGNSMESLKVGFGSVFAKMKRDFADLSDLGANLGQSLSSNLSGAFGDFVTGAKSGKDAFRSFAVSVLGDASRMFASQAIQGILGSMFGGSSPAVGRANGGPIPFAMGGKVPAMLTGGEYYIGPKAAKSIGYDTLHRLNKYADGGMVRGGSGVKDDVPARLAPGSFIIKKSAVGKLGPDYLDSLVNGKVQHRFFGGLLMGAVMGGALGYATGGKKGAIAGAIIGGIGGGLAQNYSQTGSLFKADAGAGAFQFGPSAASGPTLQANVNPGVGMGSDFVRNMDPATMSAASLAQKTAMPMWQKAALGLGASALLGGVSSMLAPKDPKFTPMNATEISANRVRLETEQRGMTPPSGLFPWLSANPNGGSNQMGYVLPPTRRMYANGGMVDFESPALFENGGKVAPQSPRIFADAGKTGFQSPRVLTNSGKPAFQSPLAFVTNEKVDPRPSIAFANRENVDFQSPRLFANGGKVDFQSPRLFSNGGMATASEKMDLQSPRLFADGGIVSNAGKMNFQSPRLFANGGMVSSGGKTDFQSPRLFANGGTVSSGEEANFQSPRLFAAGGMVTSGGGMNLQPPRLFAGGGMVTGGGGVDFQAPRLFADGGMVDGGGSVEMAKPMTSSSGGGGSSNVNVKIEINNNGTSSASASSDKKDGQGGFGPDFAMKLQKQVQGIVQQELVNQSRSDGFFAQKNRFVQGR
jgi:hypothetical protein